LIFPIGKVKMGPVIGALKFTNYEQAVLNYVRCKLYFLD